MSFNCRKIAVFGGSFDPPTIAHIQIVSEIYNNFPDIDEVWIIPCGDGRSDKKLRTPGVHRLAMVELILKDIIDECVPIKVCDIEIRKGEYMPTYKMLSDLKEEHSDCDFVFCMGADLVNSLRSWENAEKLIDEFEFIVISRPNYQADPNLFPKSYRKMNTIIDGSSTKVRNRIKEHLENKLNLAINGLTTTSVIKYIKEHDIYASAIVKC